MARSHVTIALVATCVVLLATLALVQQFGGSEDFTWHGGSPKPWTISSQQVLHDFEHKVNAADQYLLGVGKADITG